MNPHSPTQDRQRSRARQQVLQARIERDKALGLIRSQVARKRKHLLSPRAVIVWNSPQEGPVLCKALSEPRREGESVESYVCDLMRLDTSETLHAVPLLQVSTRIYQKRSP